MSARLQSGPNTQVACSPETVATLDGHPTVYGGRSAGIQAGRPHADLVADILSSCRLRAVDARFVAQGATSRVWRAETSIGPVVVRLGDPNPGKTARFGADAAVRRRLHAIGARVAEPLAVGRWNEATSGTDAGVAWCIDRFVSGETAPRGAIPERVCHDLGRLLYLLHALPVVRYGLLEDRQDALIGQAPDPVAGLLTRLQDPWPFTPFPLSDHPLAAAAPDLVPHLSPLAGRLEATLSTRWRPCPNHTDLHEGQFLIADGRLAGLLDFGDATIGPPAWDIASFAYFHGWSLAMAVLDGYTDDEERRHGLATEAHAFAILIAFHRASRAATLRRPRHLEEAIRFLRRTLTAEPTE